VRGLPGIEGRILGSTRQPCPGGTGIVDPGEPASARTVSSAGLPMEQVACAWERCHRGATKCSKLRGNVSVEPSLVDVQDRDFSSLEWPVSAGLKLDIVAVDGRHTPVPGAQIAVIESGRFELDWTGQFFRWAIFAPRGGQGSESEFFHPKRKSPLFFLHFFFFLGDLGITWRGF